MPRKINQKCLECSRLSAKDAQELHGPEAKKKDDRCWNEARCSRKRSHYRNRQKLNEKRRMEYQQRVVWRTSEHAAVETVELPVVGQSEPYACLYIWREKRKTAPIHAISTAVFRGDLKVLESVPIHCAGYRKRQIDDYVRKDLLGYLRSRFAITFFAEEIRLEPIECPIPGCPYQTVPSAMEVLVNG